GDLLDAVRTDELRRLDAPLLDCSHPQASLSRALGGRIGRGEMLLAAEVQMQVGRDRSELAQRARLELADALARDHELPADLLERLLPVAAEPEPAGEHVAHPRLQVLERPCELCRAQPLRRRLLGLRDVLVLDQVAVEALAVADGRLERDRVLDEL